MLRWIPNRFRRFSIRTLLVAFTFIGAIAGLVGIQVRNAAQLRSVKQLIASANCQSLIIEGPSVRQMFAGVFEVNLQLPIDAVSPEGFTKLQRAASLIDRRRQQEVDFVTLIGGKGEADLPRTKQALAAFAPRHLQLVRMSSAEATFLLNNCPCQTIHLSHRREWSSTATVTVNCRTFLYNGEGFANFWRCVSPQSSVNKVYVFGSTPAELRDIFPTSALAEIEIDTQHMDECEVVQLVARLHGVFIHLKCCGLTEEQETRLHEAFAPNLMLQRKPCFCNVDPFG